MPCLLIFSRKFHLKFKIMKKLKYALFLVIGTLTMACNDGYVSPKNTDGGEDDDDDPIIIDPPAASSVVNMNTVVIDTVGINN